MSNEREQNAALLKAYAQIKNNPAEIVKQAARKRLLNFARYMQPDMVVEPFHAVYYTVLDMFAHGKIRKLIVNESDSCLYLSTKPIPL